MKEEFDFTTVVNREGTGNMKEYITPEAVKKAGLVTFNAAEMDFKTAPSVIRSMKECAEAGLFGFTLPDEPFLDAVVWWMESQRHCRIDPEWIVPTNGTIFSVATCIRLAVGEGQAMIVQNPVYNRYEQAADRIGRRTVFNPLKKEENGNYVIDFDDLEEKMADPDNTLLILCNPHNPLGRVWSEEDLTRIARLAVRYGVLVYSDEIFADYTFEGHEVTPYFTVNDGKNNGITAVSLGKTFNFTGVNQANMIISDEKLRERFIHQKYSDHYGSLDPMARAAYLGGYTDEGARWKDAVKDLVWENYQLILRFMRQNLPEVQISPLQGGYVIWIDWNGLGMTQAELKHKLEDEAMVILEDGSDFCIDEQNFTRMNIATPRSVIEGALERLKKAFSAGGEQ